MRFVKKFFGFVKWFIIILTLTLVLNSWYQQYNGVVQPMFFGWGAAVVQTGSMEPNVPVGTLIVIHKQDSYEKGDIITYIDYRNWSITHRIEFIQDGIVSTRGDANQISDPLFSSDAIVGKMVFMMPGAGVVLDFLKQPVVIVILVGLLFISIIWDVVAKHKQKLKCKKSFVVKPKLNLAEKYVARYEQEKMVEARKVVKQGLSEPMISEPIKPVINTTIKKYVPKNQQ